MDRSDRRRRMSAVQGRTTSRSWPSCSSARKAHPIHSDNSVAGSRARRRGNGGGCVVEVEAIELAPADGKAAETATQTKAVIDAAAAATKRTTR